MRMPRQYKTYQLPMYRDNVLKLARDVDVTSAAEQVQLKRWKGSGKVGYIRRRQIIPSIWKVPPSSSVVFHHS